MIRKASLTNVLDAESGCPHWPGSKSNLGDAVKQKPANFELPTGMRRYYARMDRPNERYAVRIRT